MISVVGNRKPDTHFTISGCVLGVQRWLLPGVWSNLETFGFHLGDCKMQAIVQAPEYLVIWGKRELVFLLKARSYLSQYLVAKIYSLSLLELGCNYFLNGL